MLSQTLVVDYIHPSPTLFSFPALAVSCVAPDGSRIAVNAVPALVVEYSPAPAFGAAVDVFTSERAGAGTSSNTVW